MKLSVVIPACNEEQTLPQVLLQIASVLDGIQCEAEFIVVDDGSVDGTWCVLRQLKDESKWQERLKAVRFSRNFGKEAAIVAGITRACGEAVVVMDADLQHPPALLPKMLDLWLKGEFQIVEAVKRERQAESRSRRFSARVFYQLLRAGAGLDLRNSTDFKLLDRRVVEQYLEMPECHRFFRGLTAWLGLPTASLEIEIPARSEGRTSWSLSSLLKMARGNIVSFTAFPLRLITWIGLAGLLFSVLMTAQTLWNTFFGASEAGFPTVIILLLGMGSLILLSLGILGEYVSELYNEVKRRPAYVIRETLP